MIPEGICFTSKSGSNWWYRTDRPLGRRGQFGAVYAAEGADGTRMAVKVIDKQRPYGVIDDRLLRREVEIGKQVSDSGSDMLLPPIDVGETDEALLLVMPRAEKALADVAIPINESAIRAVLIDITSGLQQLHAIGIIHRDLKPANILRHEGHWKLADFGIARNQEIGTQDLTFSGFGSHQYMAPEIWELKSPTVKTDLYALGCLAYELLAGSPPYKGNREVARRGHLMCPSPEAPADDLLLRRLIGSLIAKNPGNRPQDSRDVLERLRIAPSVLSPAQQRIASALYNQAADRDRSDAMAAVSEVEAEKSRQFIAQARRDLVEIIQDALGKLQEVEPSASLGEGTAPGAPDTAIDRASKLDRALAPVLGTSEKQDVVSSEPTEVSSVLRVNKKSIRIDFRGTFGSTAVVAKGSVVIFVRDKPRGGAFIMGGIEHRTICRLECVKVDNRFEWRAYRFGPEGVGRDHNYSARSSDINGTAVEFTVELLLDMIADTLLLESDP